MKKKQDETECPEAGGLWFLLYYEYKQQQQQRRLLLLGSLLLLLLEEEEVVQQAEHTALLERLQRLYESGLFLLRRLLLVEEWCPVWDGPAGHAGLLLAGSMVVEPL